MSDRITDLPVAATIDAVNDTFPIVTNSLNTTQQINRNTFLNLASQPVGLTDSQTMTNKTLTSPTINGATLSGTLTGTYTIGGTPTFPSSVTQNTATQTLTNKTLTSPTINSPTITNASITADSITGYTTSNNGSIYGMSVTAGVLASAALAGAVNTAAIQTNAVAASQLATSAIKLASSTITSSTTVASATLAAFSTPVSITVTVPSGGRDIKLVVSGSFSGTTSGDGYSIGWYEGASLINNLAWTQNGNSSYVPIHWTTHISAPSAGSHTYLLYGQGASATTLTMQAGVASSSGGAGNCTILVEAV